MRLPLPLVLAFLYSPTIMSAPPAPLDLTRGSSGDPEVVLSFDGGSGAEGAAEILAILRERGVRTTFFLTGRFIERYPDLVVQMHSDGHEIANHTWSHSHLTTWGNNGTHRSAKGITRDWLADELRRTDDAFFALTGDRMTRFWRAPYGEHNSDILRWASEEGWQHVGWTSSRGVSLDSLDWVSDRRSRRYLSPDAIVDRILGFDEGTETLAGAIVLMHLGSDRPAHDRAVIELPRLIDTLMERGYRLVRVSELVDGGRGEGR